MTKVIVSVDTVAFDHKPTSKETEDIQRRFYRIKPRKAEISEIANLFITGHTIRPTDNRGTKNEHFISQRLFVCDVDNSYTDKKTKIWTISDRVIEPAEAVAIAKSHGLSPVFVYTTYSDHSPKYQNLPRFRLCFVSDRTITNRGERDRIDYYINTLFGQSSDDSTLRSSTLYYGGRKLVYEDYDAVFNADEILKRLPFIPDKSIEQPKIRKRSEAKAEEKQSQICESDVDMDVIRAIERHDVTYLRNRFGSSETIVFETANDFFDYLYTDIDFCNFLGVQKKSKFLCVFHSESQGSANIYKSHGKQLYYCFGCQRENTNMNLRRFIEKVGRFKSQHEAILFIQEIFNLRIKETELSKARKADLDYIIECLCRADDEGFQSLCPIASSNLRANARKVFMQMLVLAKSTVYNEMMPKQEKTDIIFYASRSMIRKRTGIPSYETIDQGIKILQYHGLIRQIPNADLPKECRAKALEAGAKSAQRHNSATYNATAYYAIPSWVATQLETIEKNGQKWKAYGYRLGTISYDGFLRTEGVEVARAMYPDTSTITTKNNERVQRSVTRKSEKLHKDLEKHILIIIDSQGYCTEAEALYMTESDRPSIGKRELTAKTQLKRSLGQILRDNHLKKVRANKELKAEYQIECKGYPSIIIRDN